MALRKNIEKLDAYYVRLSEGKAEKIKPGHVEKVIAKLKAKQAALAEEVAASPKASKRARLERKLLIAGEQLKRAEWLLQELLSERK